ncbi:MAG: acyl carrier protein [Bacilli bacterium]|nr:acyl carrier protein [Bacilli bacterium]
MDNKNLEKQVIELIASVAEVPAKSISLNSNLILDVGLESLDVVTLISRFEEEFEMTIPDKDIKELQTVEDIVNYIKSHE